MKKKAVLLLLFIFLFGVALFTGRFSLTPLRLFHYFSGMSGEYEDIIKSVVFEVRLPRIIAAFIVGASLSSAGAVFQGIFKNPMVSPAILGASSGAAFGACLAILLSFPGSLVLGVSFLHGLVAVGITLFTASFVSNKSRSMLVLILSGMLVSTLFSSLISLIKFVADPYSKLPDITFWLLGSLGSIEMKEVLIVSLFSIIGFLILYSFRWKINVLSLDEDDAVSLGVNTSCYRVVVIIAATLMTAAAVSICGLVGWVGLVIPHIVRMLLGPDFRDLLPWSYVIGGMYMIGVDTAARSLLVREIPLGILTALVGAPFFVFLMFRMKRVWN